jgi:hypothetical protein
MDPAGQMRAWPRKLNVTVDIVESGDPTAAPIRYVDIGAVEHASPWDIRAGCVSAADRDTLEGYFGADGTLTTVAGRSYQVRCVQADVETATGDGLFYVQLAFELLSVS